MAQRTPPLPKKLPRTGFYVHHPVSTKNKEAQRWFDQGLTQIYALDYSEASKSFQRAASADPTMAMAFWGISYALGSDYYYKTQGDPAREQDSYKALQRAVTLSTTGPAAERAYIAALGRRYCHCPNPDRERLAVEFKDGMRDLAQGYPNDLDAATLYAQSIMNLKPWELWDAKGLPWEGTPQILSVLESVLKRDPHHLGAIHYYIHAVEASPDPGRALAYASILPSVAPPIGHLVHMPAHIYVRTGYYLAAEKACLKAARLDENHIESSPDMFTVMSYLHDLYFLAAAASMDGHYLTARNASSKLAERVGPHVKAMRQLEPFLTVEAAVLVRFHHWDDILKQPQPAATLKIANSMWHFSRGMAFAATGMITEAEKEGQALADTQQASSDEIFGMSATNKTGDILKIASEVLAAKLASARHKRGQAVSHLRDAVAIQDNLKYSEPPSWFYPLRESLGATLFLDGQTSEAEQVFRDDLRRNPKNPRSLFGLLQILRSRGQSHETDVLQKEFDTTWQGSLQQLNLQSY